MATETDLVRQVMMRLAVLAAGETPSAEDSEDIIEVYEQHLEYLTDEDYADWDADNIPAIAMPGLVRVIASECGPMFGVEASFMKEPDGSTWNDRGLSLLRRYMRRKPSYEATQAEYF